MLIILTLLPNMVMYYLLTHWVLDLVLHPRPIPSQRLAINMAQSLLNPSMHLLQRRRWVNLKICIWLGRLPSYAHWLALMILLHCNLLLIFRGGLISTGWANIMGSVVLIWRYLLIPRELPSNLLLLIVIICNAAPSGPKHMPAMTLPLTIFNPRPKIEISIIYNLDPISLSSCLWFNIILVNLLLSIPSKHQIPICLKRSPHRYRPTSMMILLKILMGSFRNFWKIIYLLSKYSLQETMILSPIVKPPETGYKIH